ncbi:MAG TPA: tRNA epoxyqueuosine(34) reductase QueG [Thermomicrobiales bacterium]|nr:tRNA epoxyqueuosine(34) reductase QueG [Thermomicrobiales bacterium]
MNVRNPTELSDAIKELARAEGLAVASITTAEPFPGLTELLDSRIEAGHLHGMDWFTPERSVVSANPRMLHERAQSIISVGIPYYRSDIQKPDDGVKRGRIARYAWGADYHKTLKNRMARLAARIESKIGGPMEVRLLVDTARIVDRAVAARSGLGWYGKHTNIIVPGHGSFVMLGEILIDLELEPDQPLQKDCGRCQICLNRCPTGAIVAPYTVSAPLCISYQTIENRGMIPLDVRGKMDDWVFGCDVCQDVCPYTGAAKSMIDEAFRPATIDNAFPSLHWLLQLSEEEFRSVYRGTAVLRTKRAGLARNAAIALGNSGDPDDLPVLADALRSYDLPLVRAHAAWAMGRIGGESARIALGSAGHSDPDPEVRAECRSALEIAA